MMTMSREVVQRLVAPTTICLQPIPSPAVGLFQDSCICLTSSGTELFVLLAVHRIRRILIQHENIMFLAFSVCACVRACMRACVRACVRVISSRNCLVPVTHKTCLHKA